MDARRRGWIAALALAAALLGGCATVEPPHLAPAPAAFRDARLDFERGIPESLRTTRVPVFFATTRRATDGPEHFDDAQGQGVTLGVAGVLGAAGTDEALTEADRAFIAAIDAQLARIANPDLVLYVHGYRVKFDEVAVQMGSFAHYLGNAAVVTFQWPTGMMFWNYVTDCPRARAYIPDIERTLALLARTRSWSTSWPTAAARRCSARRCSACARAIRSSATTPCRRATASATSCSWPPTSTSRPSRANTCSRPSTWDARCSSTTRASTARSASRR